MTRPLDARDSFGEVKIVNAGTLDEVLAIADLHIRAFVGDRTYTIWQTRAGAVPLYPDFDMTDDGPLGWDVEVSWRVTS